MVEAIEYLSLTMEVADIRDSNESKEVHQPGSSLTQEYEEKAELLKALGHPARLCIVRNLLENRRNVNQMRECLRSPQSTVSQHLAVLRTRGIIKGEKVGVETYYRVVSEDAKKVVTLLFPKP